MDFLLDLNPLPEGWPPKSKAAARLHEMLCSRQQVAAMPEAGESDKEDYDKRCCHCPEFDKSQHFKRVPPQALSNMPTDTPHCAKD
ncbi:hypothetical protein WMO64_05335 [Pseudoflavonifractor sp. CLA-AP-H29]|uniref:Uncharacterized protein n=1 Tax=Pseudoflavonifractor intestinihominis TaxID=3133171 RepID=A0ABV1E6G6_9FIRM